MGNHGTCPSETSHSIQGSFKLHYHDYISHVATSPSYRGLNAVVTRGTIMALPHRPVIAHGDSNPQMHHGHACQVPGWIHRWQWKRTSKFLTDSAPESMSLMVPSRWGGPPMMPSAGHTSWAGLSSAVLLQCLAWWWSQMLLYWQSQDVLSLLPIPWHADCYGHPYSTCCVHNTWENCCRLTCFF
jgi:hypothetical protein